jgi:hypothetical protein
VLFGLLGIAAVACTGSIPEGDEASGGRTSSGGGKAGAGAKGGNGGTVSSNGGAGADTGLPPLPANAPCRVAVPMRRLTELQIRNAVRDVFKGQASFASDFGVPTIGSPSSGFTGDANYNAVDLGVVRSFNDGAMEVALSLFDKLPMLEACASGSPGEPCATTFIDDYGKRLFRRPLTTDEKTTLLKVYRLASGVDAFKDGVAAVITAMLQSPQFLYQNEAATAAPDASGGVALSGYEIASRLGFLLWDSVPDDALLTAAGAGELGTADGIRKQAERMLGDAKAKASIVRFAREWIKLEVPKPGDRKDTSYTQPLADAMQSELDGFLGDSFLGTGTFESLFTSSAAFKNQTLTTYYGAHGGVGPRSGLLTQPAFMTGIAGPADTSPIRRAVFIRKRVTCETFPDPPNNAQAVDAALPLPADATQRQRSAARNMNTTCAACHKLIDPLGFGFESFDELGRYRTKLPNGTDVDAHGDFVQPVSDELAGPFDSVAQLGKRLAASSTVQTCLSRQYFRFTFGRLDADADACSIDGLAKTVAAKGLSLRELLLGIVSADEFRYRRVQ